MRVTVSRVALLWKRWEWEVYSSAYGLAFGRRWTRRAAIRAALDTERLYLTEAL